MSFQFDRVNPDGDKNHSDFNQAIENFNEFMDELDEAIENQEFESDREDLEDFKESIREMVKVFECGAFTIQVWFEADRNISLYKLNSDLDVIWMDMMKNHLEIHMRQK